MNSNRRIVLAGLAAAPLLALPTRFAFGATPTILKIAHQFPAGSGNEGDFRDRLCRHFAQELDKRSNGALKANVYPGASLMKVNAQFSSVRKGALDMTLIPLSYVGGEVAELNISLMPGLVTSYEQGYNWKTAPIGKALVDLLADKGVILVSWIWQAGGAASRNTPIVFPEDVKGLKFRGGSREMDLVAKAAGAATVSMPSNETYAAMQTGAIDVVTTSATSLLSFRLQEVSKHLTINKQGKSYWFMLEPLLMSKAVFDKLPKDQQSLIMTVGTEMEKVALAGARADDVHVTEAYIKKGAIVHDLTEAALAKWVALARISAWKDYAEKSPNNARLLKLAEAVSA
ncbi:TRAP transporter substrate-binding protein DctP [Glaciimonas sp. PCH181]|uniref:TRAP transporter substrate-binding protein DctP n=1 Tax=Glaciimonas sp. PCH181 TaxID=2133943 RepID=UPI000D365956|nr:TRAP transporter substrate-binding protein DctP [Glaciimonas sp. PCH181]PUA16951.1 C4-dicarboxylate ABC transporter [Glaciimonas sp. PCH181]